MHTRTRSVFVFVFERWWCSENFHTSSPVNRLAEGGCPGNSADVVGAEDRVRCRDVALMSEFAGGG